MNESDDYLWDGSGKPDREVAHFEQLLSPLKHAQPLDELRLRRKRSRAPWIAGGIVAAAAVLAIVWWRWPRDRAETYACRDGIAGFTFAGVGGNRIACGGKATPSGVLPIGETLDTGAHEADLAIANIGNARLGANTRVRLDRTGSDRHQLFLETGTMHAKVVAPPRLFAVSTPGASVTDLGCEYTLEVDERGAGAISVETGKVELESGDGELFVLPAGARARLLPGRRAGLPLVKTAAADLVAAVEAFDRNAPDGAQRVMATATADDAFTVAQLAVRTPAPARRAVLERLAVLFPPPAGVTLDEAISQRPKLEAWIAEIRGFHDSMLFLKGQ